MNSFVGAIWSFGFNFAPYGWAQCNGQLLPIAEYQALYSLIGTTYGGDGQSSFGVPDLRGRTPIGVGNGAGLPAYVLGQSGGSESVTLTAANLPPHNHAVLSASVPTAAAASTSAAASNYFATGSTQVYNSAGGSSMANTTGVSGNTGSSIPLSILSPYLCINYCISLFGIYPTRN